MCDKQKREIDQLRFVADKYFELAETEKANISQAALHYTVGKITEYWTNDTNWPETNKSLVYLLAHLASCAIRLYSIDENLKPKRWKSYYEKLITMSDPVEIETEIKQNLDVYVHFLLRHMVAHAESERKRNQQYKKAFEVMYSVYLSLEVCALFNSMKQVKMDIEQEISLI